MDPSGIMRRVFQGAHVLPSADAAEALIPAASRRAGLRSVVTRVQMSHKDGVQFLKEHRQVFPSIPVIAASGRLGEVEEQALKSLGVTVRLEKPFTQHRLLDPLRSVLAPKSPWRSQRG